MRDAVELAAQFIRRADFVLANDVLREEYSVELAHPAQIGYCSFDPEDIIGEALEHTAKVFGCLTYTKDAHYLTVVGEKEAIDKLEEVRQVALSDEYGYKGLMNKALPEVDITGIDKEGFERWKKNCILGFFDGLIGNFDLGRLGMYSKHPHVLGILDGADSANRCVKENK